MKKFSFTKIIMGVMLLLNIAVVVFACVMMWRTGDLTPMGYLLMGEGGAMATWLASYAWKEKAANRSKYAMEFVKEFDEKHGTATALQFAEIVLRD